MLKSRDFLRMSYRATFLLTLWNDRTLQGPGFAWTIESKRCTAGRAAGYAAGFNTTPAMAPCVIGAVARMEDDGEPPENISMVKDSGSTSLAAVGDQLFWGSLRPSAALAGLVALQLGPIVSAALLLLAQGLPQLAFRILGLARGLKLGKLAIPVCIVSARRVFALSSVAGAVLAGMFAGAVVRGAAGVYGSAGAFVLVVSVPLFCWLISAGRTSPSRICLTILALSGVLSLLMGS
jgi:PTS system mannose-specific IID component